MWCLFGPPDWSVCHPVASSTCLQVQALLALCHLHVVPVWPSRLVSLSSSSPLLLAYRCRPYLLCAACMWCLFGPPDWSVCHPVASSTCPQVQVLLALCHLHVVPVLSNLDVKLGAARMPALSSVFAICSMDPCAVQHACYMRICSMKACCACLVWAIHIRTHVTANQVPALYVLSVYNVIAGVHPDPSIQATTTFLSGLAINLTYVPHCTRLYLTRCNTVDSRYCRAQLSALYREVPLIQR